MAGRTWLAVILCFFVWWGYTKFFMPPPPAPVPSTTETASPSTPSAPANPTGMTAAEGDAGPFPVITQAEVTATQENEAVKVDFSKFGGRPVLAVLPRYSKSIELDPKVDANRISPLNPTQFPYSLATLFSEKTLSDLALGEYEQKQGVSTTLPEIQPDGSLKETQKPNGLQYTRVSPSGVRLTKTYWLSSDGYNMDVAMTLDFPEGERTDWGSMLIPVGGYELENDVSQPLKHWRVTLLQNGSTKEELWDSIKKNEPKVLQGETAWLSFGNRYFSSVVATQSTLNPDVVVSHNPRFVGAYLRFPLIASANARQIQFKFQYYLGPKDTHYLTSVPGLTSLVNYGWVSILAHPLLALLKIFYSWVHNYGVAIILLTLLVRGAFYPLTAKSMKSMKEMQKLSPQLKALREKYADDRERMQREQMALYKAHKINPAAGCLPMLVQLPVFIALYQVLANAMELFHAPFFGWIHDLSSKDPYYIYPVLMGITMLIQQKLTPNAGMDPAQQKVMYIMPVVFTFIMLNLPSGLTLYIFVSTLLGITQQWAMRANPGNAVAVKVESKGAAKG